MISTTDARARFAYRRGVQRFFDRLTDVRLGGDVTGARVVTAYTRDGHALECTEELRPSGRWRVTLSTLSGCPVRCAMCDAGGHYEGRLTGAELLAQLDVLWALRFSDVPPAGATVEVHFTRMGEPAFNTAVLDVLEALPPRFPGARVVPLLSSVAPAGGDVFFERLLEVRRRYGPDFALQFSLHTTDETVRRGIVPVKTWPFARIAAYGARFHRPGEAKVRLAFAAAREWPLDAAALRTVFDPAHFAVRLMPLVPTVAVQHAELTSRFAAGRLEERASLVRELEAAGFDVEVDDTHEVAQLRAAACGRYAGGGREGPVRPRRTLGGRAGAASPGA